MNRADVERRVEIGSAEEPETSTLDVERRLNEGVDERQAVGSPYRVQGALERQLRLLARPRAPPQRDVE